MTSERGRTGSLATDAKPGWSVNPAPAGPAPGWRVSPALAGAVVVGVLGFVAAFVMSRVEPALVAAPLLLAAALAWDRRPRAAGRRNAIAEDSAGPDTLAAGPAPVDAGAVGPVPADVGAAGPVPADVGAAGPAPIDADTAGLAPVDRVAAAPARAAHEATGVDIAVTADLAACDGDGAPAAAVRIRAATPQTVDALQLRLALGQSAPIDAVLTPAAARSASGEVPLVHSGRQRVAAVAGRAVGPDAAWTGEPGEEAVLEQVVRPRRAPVRALPLPARLLGLTGQHISARPGDGGEFRDVDLFHPGDRLRRIDWRATARAGRSGELYVRRTTATSDAAVHLVVDARDDVSGIVADWSRAYPRPAVSSLDLAREAAVSLASAYASAGDRVGFDDLGGAQRVLPPRAGVRHRERVLRAIELTTATGTLYQRVRAPRLSSGALVYVLSTFLDDQPGTLALTWRAAGHRVIAVDVLPVRDARELTARERLALRTVELERRLRLAQLQSGGVELLTWAGRSAPDATLRALATGGGRR